MPARDALAKDWERVLDHHRKKGVDGLRDYYRTRQREPGKAMEGAIRAILEGFLYVECADGEILKILEGWEKDAKKLKIEAAVLKAFRQVVPAYKEALEKGWREFSGLNQKF